MILMVIIVLAILIGIFCLAVFGIGTGILGIGGMTTSAFVKDRTIKILILIGFSCVLIFGFLCAAPFLALYFKGFPFLIISFVSCICLAVLSISAMVVSGSLKNKIAKMIIRIIFSLVMAGGLVGSLLIILFFISAI